MQTSLEVSSGGDCDWFINTWYYACNCILASLVPSDIVREHRSNSSKTQQQQQASTNEACSSSGGGGGNGVQCVVKDVKHSRELLEDMEHEYKLTLKKNAFETVFADEKITVRTYMHMFLAVLFSVSVCNVSMCLLLL